MYIVYITSKKATVIIVQYCAIVRKERSTNLPFRNLQKVPLCVVDLVKFTGGWAYIASGPQAGLPTHTHTHSTLRH